MVPLKLVVKNFICYGDNVPTLNLESIHVACLSGENGNGKSALLDAMTWAVWGKSRARTQDELIHQGQTNMSVELEFTARDQRYRITRRYSRPGGGRRGTTLLDLQISSGDSYRAITANTVNETEALIRNVVHMDYDTFVNTAFLLQGHADMFTRSSASQRKECLAEVLDLSYYEVMEERAKAQSKLIEDSVKETEFAITQKQAELETKDAKQDLLKTIIASLTTLEPQAEVSRSHVDKLRRKVDSLRHRRTEIEDLTLRLSECRSDIETLASQKQEHESRISEYETLLTHQGETEERYTRLQRVRDELDHLNIAYKHLVTLQAEKSQLNQAVAVQRERLSSQVTQINNHINDVLQPKARQLPLLEQSITSLQVEEQILDAKEMSLGQKRNATHDISARLKSLEDANIVLRQAMGETREKFDLLQHQGAECPICRQSLKPEDRVHVRAEYERQGKQSSLRYRENSAEQSRLEKDHSKLATELSRVEVESNTAREEYTRKRTALYKDLHDSRQAQEQLQPALADRDVVQAQLESESFAVEEQSRMAELDAQIAEVGYDSDTHNTAQRDTKDLERYAHLFRKLNDAKKALPIQKQGLAGVATMLNRRRAESVNHETEIAALKESLVTLPSIETELRETEQHLRELATELEQSRVQRSVVTQELARLDRLQNETTEAEKKHGTLVEEQAVYDELAVALGKNGVQALIIESAIPQIENDANQLLSRLTDNRMSVKLQLQQGRRERRLGLPSEELDIRVGDELGTRSYETFSGGEAFRINFALRIALSRLLARRSGAPLPILFIDEGFGSQDTTGQERLKEAIQSIQDDFQKIIVITHIDEIKESFPTRIEVTKTPMGSTFTMV